MVEVLVLTGTCGVGKTTVANAWADGRMRRGDAVRGAAVHADDVRMWMREKGVRRARGYQEELILEVCLVMARGMVEQGVSVVVENVWRPGSMERWREEFGGMDGVRFWGVRLVCELSENEGRDQGRPVGRMGARVGELAAELEGLVWPSWVGVVDSTGLSVEETLARVEGIGS